MLIIKQHELKTDARLFCCKPQLAAHFCFFKLKASLVLSLAY